MSARSLVSIKLPALFWPVFLCLAVVVVYVPSLSARFLNWDDPWLIEHNQLLQQPGFDTLLTIVSDFSRGVRLKLGAEYLPVRDLSVFLELQLFGKQPLLFRLVNLGLYLCGVLIWRAYFRRVLENPFQAEIVAWVFALHPVHAESVAWLSGRKDVLALLFLGLSLWAHAGSHRWRWAFVPTTLLLSHFSKAASVIGVGLLVVSDFLKGRKPQWTTYVLALVAALAAASIHLLVGHLVGMTTEPPGGSRYTAFITMGDVFLRYAVIALWPASLSIVHDVPTRTNWTLGAVSGYAFLALTLGAGAWLWLRRKKRWALSAWAWFALPLIVVSQFLFALQNRMADRYLWLSVAAVGMLLAAILKPRRLDYAVAFAACLLLGAATAQRAHLFSDSRLVFADATRKTSRSLVAPYQLGHAHEANNDVRAAIAAYETVLARRRGREEAARRASNNLARLYARQGRLSEAETLLRQGMTLWPDDPKLLSNLVKIKHRQGDENEANRLFLELKRRFPDYRRRIERSSFLGSPKSSL